MHLLVLWLDDIPGPLQDRLAELRRGRDVRNLEVIRRLNSLGLEISVEEVRAKAGEGSVGRPHIAAVMVERGYVPDIVSAFDEYLGHGRPAYVSRVRLTPEEAIRLARASGGVPVLAHPHTLGFDDQPHRLEEVLRLLGEWGLVGLESHHSAVEPERRRQLRRLADRMGLLPSGGSDFHGTYKPLIEIGMGCGDLEVPDEFLDGLRDARSTL